MAKGIAVALLSGFAFAMSGPFGKPLLEAGWSPGGVVLVRLWIATLVTVVPMVLFARERLATLRRSPGAVIAYGLLAVLGTNLFYFNAISQMSVTVSLLIEFSAPVLVIGYLWARFGRRPSALTAVGAVIALSGLALVVGTGQDGAVVTARGVMWALLAMVGVAVYFLMAHDGTSDAGDGPEVDQLALVVGGLVVGALALSALAAAGVVPIRTSTAAVNLGTLGEAPWWVPAIVVGAVATGFAYLAGILAINLVGPTLASFLAFCEVLVSASAAWVLLGEALSMLQLGGAALIMAGVLAVKRGERPSAAAVPERGRRRERRGSGRSRRRPVTEQCPGTQVGAPALD